MGNTQMKKLGEESDESQSFRCKICQEPSLLPYKKFKTQHYCFHTFCTDCIVKYISVMVEENVANIPCPSPSCHEYLDPIFCQNLLGPELFVKWSDKLCESFVLGGRHCYCPNRNCSALILDECRKNGKRSQCPNCKSYFCFKCKVPWHEGFKCKESAEFRDQNDVAFSVLAKSKRWKRCPRCRNCVQRIDGCNIVKCRCGGTFCYNCGRQITNNWCSNCDFNPAIICGLLVVVLVLVLLFFGLALYIYFGGKATASKEGL